MMDRKTKPENLDRTAIEICSARPRISSTKLGRSTILKNQPLSPEKVLSISPDCADAYVLLAEAQGSLAKALELHCKSAEAGEACPWKRGFRERGRPICLIINCFRESFLPTLASVTKVKRCAADNLNAWQATAGALVWLAQIDDKPPLLN
jgi:hypothetical protein